MSQEYTPVDWVDETTSQQGTLINAERLTQMQTAHHYADGFEEVDAIPTEDPGVDYHKVVYCTADATFYRWDGTQWTADIDEDTKRLLDQEIARATQAEGVLQAGINAEASAREAADDTIEASITAEATARANADTALGERITQETTARESADTTLQGNITAEATAREVADTSLGASIDAETAARVSAIAALQAGVYTKAEADNLLASKAPVTALTDGSVTKVGTADIGSDLRPIKLVGGVPTAVTNDLATQAYVGAALDSYAPMVRTTGNQLIGSIKSFNLIEYCKYHRAINTTNAAANTWAKAFSFNMPDNIMFEVEIVSGFNNTDTQYARLKISKTTNTLGLVAIETIGSTSEQAASSNYVITEDSGTVTLYTYKRHRYTRLYAMITRYTSYGAPTTLPTITWLDTVSDDPSTETHDRLTVASILGYRNQ